VGVFSEHGVFIFHCRFSEVYFLYVTKLLCYFLFQIRRPYFHVKPLEKSQLKNWREYLKFEMENGSEKRVGVLFERCVIACALYEEFWMKVCILFTYCIFVLCNLLNLCSSIKLIPRIISLFGLMFVHLSLWFFML